MPFKIDRSYRSPTFTDIPSDDELREYIRWLEKELYVAKAELAARTPKTAKELTVAKQLASRGGKARAAKMIPEQWFELAKKAAAARWNKAVSEA